jgi:hypothetical protein
MVDVSKFNINTPVKIKILNNGIYIPELNTYTPLETYASVNQAISIMNRGITVDFPQQSAKKEISLKIEEILLDYEDRKNKLKDKFGKVGTDIDIALDVVQEINNKSDYKPITVHNKDNIFEYRDVAEENARQLSNQPPLSIFDADDYISADERMKRADHTRKVKESLTTKKKYLLDEFTELTDSMRRVAKDARYFLGDDSEPVDETNYDDLKL